MVWLMSLIDLSSLHFQVNFLSQIRLTNKGDGPKVAKRLIDVYFALFKVFFMNQKKGIGFP